MISKTSLLNIFTFKRPEGSEVNQQTNFAHSQRTQIKKSQNDISLCVWSGR